MKVEKKDNKLGVSQKGSDCYIRRGLQLKGGFLRVTGAQALGHVISKFMCFRIFFGLAKKDRVVTVLCVSTDNRRSR